MEKSQRAKNFSDSEQNLFTEILLPKYKEVIENKRTDAVTRVEKSEAWQKLTVEFNSISNFCYRSEKNLKNLWDKLKKNARKALAHQKKETFATGGGQRNTEGDPSLVDLRVLAVLGPSGDGLPNNCDGDAPAGDELVLFEDTTANTVVMHDISNLDCSNISVPEAKDLQENENSETWASVVPRMLYAKKPEAIRPGTNAAASDSGSSSSHESVRKRTLAEELELAKQLKRRRPTTTSPDKSQKQLNEAKKALADATKSRLEEENQRNKELFLIEKRRKESEAELVELQVLKMKKELGLL